MGFVISSIKISRPSNILIIHFISLNLYLIIFVFFQRLCIKDLNHPLTNIIRIMLDLLHLNILIPSPLISLEKHTMLFNSFSISLLNNYHVKNQLILVVILNPFSDLLVLRLLKRNINPEQLLYWHDGMKDDILIFLLNVLEDSQSFYWVAAFKIAVEIAFEWDHKVFVFYQEFVFCAYPLELTDDSTTGEEELDGDLLIGEIEGFYYLSSKVKYNLFLIEVNMHINRSNIPKEIHCFKI